MVTALPSKAFSKVSALESDLEEDGRFTRASLPIVSTAEAQQSSWRTPRALKWSDNMVGP